MFFLRITSYFFAWLGLALGAFGCLRVAKNQTTLEKVRLWNWAALGCGLWPVFFPGKAKYSRAGDVEIPNYIHSLVGIFWGSYEWSE